MTDSKLSDELAGKWKEAERTGEPVEVGRLVACDICARDWTDRPESGGIIFGSTAYCPECTIDALPRIRGYDEEHFIRARCPEGMSFADFVRKYRGPDASIHFQSGS